MKKKFFKKFFDNEEKSSHKKPVRFYILGNIKRPSDMTRIMAEIIVKERFYHFDNWNLKKTDEEMLEYNNSVCVIHLHTEIYGRGGRDVAWRYGDLSLYQMSNGNFFVAGVYVDDFQGGETLYLELESDYFETHKPSEFKDSLYKECSPHLDKGKSITDIEKLFEKRELSFYAERWCSYDYKLLFEYAKTEEAVWKDVEFYKWRFADNPDKELLCAHIEKEAQKAIEQIKNDGWQIEEYDVYEYDPYLAEFE